MSASHSDLDAELRIIFPAESYLCWAVWEDLVCVILFTDQIAQFLLVSACRVSNAHCLHFTENCAHFQSSMGMFVGQNER